MKKILIALLIMVIAISARAEYVQGHYRGNGTYVEGYHRSDRNGTTLDNYSTQGNTNPYTGEKGHKSPY